MTTTDRADVDEQPAPALDGRPVSYRLVVPPRWFRVALDDRGRAGAVRRYVEETVGRGDELATARATLRAQLEEQTRDAAERGGVEIYLSTLTVGPVPVPMSLVVTFLPGQGVTLEPDLVEQLAVDLGQDERGVAEDPCSTVQVAGQPAVRRPYLESVEPPEGETTEPVRTCGVEYFVPVPAGRGALLLLSFSTPLVSLREGVTEMFDAVAGSLAWVQ